MSQCYQVYDQSAVYYLTFQVVEWVDIFTRPEYKRIITDSFEFCRKHKGLKLYAYVIMTNHIHLIARADDGYLLSDIIRDFKKFTANKLIEKIKGPSESRSDWILKRFEFAAKKHQRNSFYQMWTHENHALELQSIKFMDQKINYIHKNPVRAGIVSMAEDYLYSSARNYAGLENELEIDFI